MKVKLTKQGVFMNIYVYMNTLKHVITINEKAAMNFKENKEENMGGFRRRSWKEECYHYI